MHDGARTVAPAISAAGLWVAGSIVDEKEVSPDSIGSNKRAEDASAAFAIATWQSELPGKRGSRIWTVSADGPKVARSPPALTRP